MNELPKSWTETRLADVCRVLSGYGFPERLQGKADGEFPFYKVGDISESWKRNESLLGRAEHYLNHDEAKDLHATPFPPGSTVFAKIGAAIGLNRRAMLSVPSLVDNNVMALVPDARIIGPKYLFHFACTLRLMEYAQATTVPSVRKSDIEEISMPVAPPKEQDRIVAEIEKQFTRLDAATAALKRAQANLKRYRASVLKAACEGRLVPTEAELARKERRDYESANQLLQRILRERRTRWEVDTLAKMLASGKPPKDDRWREKYKEPSAPNTAKLHPLPEGWCWASIDQISIVVRGASPRPAGDPRFFGGDIPWITVGMLTRDDHIYLREVVESVTEAGRQASRYIEPDTLLLTNSGATLGVPKITMIGGCINDGSVALQGLDYPEKLYLYFFLSSLTKSLRRINQGAAQPNLNTEIVKGITVPLPPRAEQVRICERIEVVWDNYQRLVAAAEDTQIRAIGLRSAVLRDAFVGALIPQNADDESASALLERIRSECNSGVSLKRRPRGEKEPAYA